MSNPLQLTIVPHLSEQGYSLSKDKVYVFKVPMTSTKQEIAKAVSKQYDVKVSTVNTTIVKGKKKSSSRKRKQPLQGQRANWKKAYVSLDKDDSISMYEVED